MAKLPLEGIRVAALTVVWAGPFAEMLLADWGAEVIRVESLKHFPVPTRGMMPRPPAFLTEHWRGYTAYVGKEPGERPWNRFALFNAHARNKLSMTVDLTQPKGMEIFKRLIEVSDIYLDSNQVQVAEKLGINYDMLRQVKPDIIMITMPGFGTTGPYKYYRAFGAHLEGFFGHTWLRGYPDSDPTTTTYAFHCDAAAGATAAFAAVMALRYRNRTGKGQWIDLAQAEAAVPHLGEAVMDYTMNRRVQGAMGNRHPSAAPCGCYRCRGEDRWVTITVTSDEEWQGLCRAMGNPSWTKDERFADGLSRYRNQVELDRLVEEWTIQHDHYAVMHLLQREGVPAGPVIDDRDALNDPHLKDRGFFEELYQEDCGTLTYPGLAWKMSKTPNYLRLPPVRLGEHNEYVYKEVLKVSDEEYAELEREGHIGMDYLV